MDETRTLAVDIGGTGIKLAVLDGAGQIIGKRVRQPTPSPPVAPQVLTETIAAAADGLGGFDRVSVGFPGVVREGRVLTAPNLGTELWAGFDLQTALAERCKKPVRVMNDADVQGFGAIAGKGVEMVLTLGTGAGTSIFNNGQIIPHLELAHHPLRGNKTYDEYIGNAALEKVGRAKWNKRIARVIDILQKLVNFDHLYIGGGNAKQIKFALPADVTIVPNSDGLTGGIALWRAEDRAHPPVAARRTALARPRPRKAAHGRTVVASQPKTAVAFAVPEGACDCHVHVFGTAAEFPFAAKRGYTPPPASAAELLALQQALHLSRVVIVQPSVYGSDNSCTLDGMRQLGSRARGVAVIDEATPTAALDRMHAAGIRGVRVNLATAAGIRPVAGAPQSRCRGEPRRALRLARPGLYRTVGHRRAEGRGRPASACRSSSTISAAPRRRAGSTRRALRRWWRWSAPVTPMSRSRPPIAARKRRRPTMMWRRSRGR